MSSARYTSFHFFHGISMTQCERQAAPTSLCFSQGVKTEYDYVEGCNARLQTESSEGQPKKHRACFNSESALLMLVSSLQCCNHSPTLDSQQNCFNLSSFQQRGKWQSLNSSHLLCLWASSSAIICWLTDLVTESWLQGRPSMGWVIYTQNLHHIETYTLKKPSTLSNYAWESMPYHYHFL